MQEKMRWDTVKRYSARELAIAIERRLPEKYRFDSAYWTLYVYDEYRNAFLPDVHVHELNRDALVNILDNNNFIKGGKR